MIRNAPELGTVWAQTDRSYSITSSTRASGDCGIVRSSAFAQLGARHNSHPQTPARPRSPLPQRLVVTRFRELEPAFALRGQDRVAAALERERLRVARPHV